MRNNNCNSLSKFCQFKPEYNENSDVFLDQQDFFSDIANITVSGKNSGKNKNNCKYSNSITNIGITNIGSNGALRRALFAQPNVKTNELLEDCSERKLPFRF